ncbi:MAG: tetratricopeptide repeat protein [Gemmatimonadota bacterium]
MSRADRRRGSDGRVPYWVRLNLVVLLLGGMTVVFVVFFLPQRYVFQSGLSSSGVSFPAQGAPFETADRLLVEARAIPPSGTDGDEEVEEEVESPVVVVRRGPAEILWEEVERHFGAGNYEAAAAAMARYLEAHPHDADVRVEYAVALIRDGRPELAEAELQRVIEERDSRRARLEYARLLRDLGRWAPAVPLYEELAREDPGDASLRLEAARVFAAAIRAELEDLRGRVAADADTASAEGPKESAAGGDRLAQARQAAEAGDVDRVAALYREEAAVESDAQRLLEWADLFQHTLEDLDGAMEVLVRVGELGESTPETQLRLARLHVWSEEEGRAQGILEELLAASPGEAEAWILLGDLRRWAGRRPAAAAAYATASSIEPGVPGLGAGTDALQEATRSVVYRRDTPGLGPALDYFRDSDGFRRVELSAHGALLQEGRDAVSIRSGLRRVEGLAVDGRTGIEEGVFAELQVARWWREATVRASAEIGVEELGAGGARGSAAGRLEAHDLDRWDLELELRRGPAYPWLTTFQSLDLMMQADRLRIAVSRPLGMGWTALAGGEALRLRADGLSTERFGGELGVYHRPAPWIRVGGTTRILGYSEAAPVLHDRRAFWDPRYFWSTELPVEIQAASTGPWTAHARVSPGIARVRYRDGEPADWVPQFGAEAGAGYLGERAALDVGLFGTRGREGDYSSLGLRLQLTIRTDR